MYNYTLKELFGEYAKAFSDWLRPKHTVRYEDKVLDDPHAHFLKPNSEKELELILRTIATGVDRQAFTHWGPNVQKVFTHNDLRDIAKNYSPAGIELRIIGNEENSVVTQIRFRDHISLVYNSQEIRTRSHIHITAEGCSVTIPEGLNPRKTIEIIHENGGIAIIEHPCTKEHPSFPYIPTSRKNDELTLELFEMTDAAEVFNSMNTLWMPISNLRARNLTQEYNKTHPHNKIALIAGTDMHYGSGRGSSLGLHFYLNHVGRSGIWLPKEDISGLDDREIIEQKKAYLRSNDDILRLENYTGPFMFYREMIPPIIYRLSKIDVDSIS